MNVTENQIDDAVGVVMETLQLNPDMADDLFTLLVTWLDDNDIEVLE